MVARRAEMNCQNCQEPVSKCRCKPCPKCGGNKKLLVHEKVNGMEKLTDIKPCPVCGNADSSFVKVA